MVEFDQCIRQCEVQDLRQTGCFFSWSNKRTGNEAIAKKIDSAMGNWEWIRRFNSVQAHFPPPGISDHSPCIIPLSLPLYQGGRPFKYLNIWGAHPLFLEKVKVVWSQSVGGSPMEKVARKLRMLKPVLKELHREFFKDPVTTCSKLKHELDLQQSILDVNPADQAARTKERQLQGEYYAASRVEESVLKQKVRVQWLKLGDANSAFFHRAFKVRQSRNHISKLQKEDGEWTSTQEEVGSESVKYFHNLFQASDGEEDRPMSRAGEGITVQQREDMGKDITQ
ncbi:hypothetical protein CFOL_v3_03743 [Cephalotus follicularis]|uniref:Exo_endo_phos domain-containing protein n=1 Tax=Cephalotus follicularis TaxID=3775 RepID=A0A1Q3AXC2_CEPFO|nr:hypothetical protein CFOL_v3_03743 [Cephalotus follicularis]